MPSSNVSLQVMEYCAQECEWQHSGEMSVFNMIKGWRLAHHFRNQPITMRDVLKLGYLIEPLKNVDGLRKVNVRVGTNLKMDHSKVAKALTRLIEKDQPPLNCSEDKAVEFFLAYEEIHPWIDGNGRTGTLLFNWILGSLDEPVHAPNLWGDPRRGPTHPRGIPIIKALEAEQYRRYLEQMFEMERTSF